MGVLTVRGGIPYVLRDAAVAVGGRKIRLPFLIHYLVIRNKGAAVARLYFTEEDFTDDANYVEIPVASAVYPYGEWSGPVETASGPNSDLWMRGVGGNASLELVAFQRRG